MGKYWNNTGIAQAKYDEMEAAGWKYNATTVFDMHAYYRYYNDGDAPSHIEYLLRTLEYTAARRNPEILAYEEQLEACVTERIEIEYRRFQKALKSTR